jgi:hypothetical protein
MWNRLQAESPVAFPLSFLWPEFCTVFLMCHVKRMLAPNRGATPLLRGEDQANTRLGNEKFLGFADIRSDKLSLP